MTDAGLQRADALGELRRLAESLPRGARLPPVRELMSRFRVSQHAVQTALRALSADGLVTAHVGRGTFVGGGGGARADRPQAAREVLTLHHHTHLERGDIIAQTIHQRLTADGHRSMILTYSDAEQAMQMLRDGPRYDTCILQPRRSVVPIKLLGLLREISQAVIVENRAVEQFDVDAISNHPVVLSRLVLEHLTELGHRRIGWLVEDRGDYFFERIATLFEAFRTWRGLTPTEAPLVFAPANLHGGAGFADIDAALQRVLGGDRSLRPTALFLATSETGSRVLSAFRALNIVVPRDLSVIRIGTPDIEGEHLGELAVVGRPSRQAADTVLKRMHWRWANPDAPFATVYDPPLLLRNRSTGAPCPD
jgi:DNA-binding LacI/PurR family transcriptional regulator